MGYTGPRGHQGEQGENSRVPKRVTRSFLAIVLAATLVLTLEGYYVNQTRALARKTSALVHQNTTRVAENATTRRALCFLRRDFRTRLGPAKREVQASKDFLRKNPNGIPGIPAVLIRQGLANQEQLLRNTKGTYDALRIVSCTSLP